MPLAVRDLIQGRDKPITTTADSSLKEALETMLKNDFTQLPVVDGTNKVLGAVTSDSIVRALGAFGAPAEQLQVGDAMRPVESFDPDDDITDLLDGLRDSYAVMVESDDCLVAIVTGFDIAEHFQRQFDDLMVVQDIETTIKEHVRYAFTRLGFTEAKMADAIRRLGDPDDKAKKRLRDVIHDYAARLDSHQVDPVARDAAVESVSSKQGLKSFDRLTLYQYCELLLSDECWSVLQPHYGAMKPPALRRLLGSVQKIRNDLAHFRSNVTALERSDLGVCATWFESHAVPAGSAAAVVGPPQQAVSVDAHVAPIDEPTESATSRYVRLADWLATQDPEQEAVSVSFDQIKDVMEHVLPRSAFAHRSWWANDSVSHPQSVHWLDAGWRVSSVNLTNRVVTFSRIEGRQKAYIEFFSGALNDLRARVRWGIASQSPTGASWQLLAGIASENKQLAILAWSFARGRRFRTEIYIDSGSAVANKSLFDSLHERRQLIEARIGHGLEWERMPDRRASRVALYSDGHIQSSADRLLKLRRWAVEAAAAMHDVFQHEGPRLG